MKEWRTPTIKAQPAPTLFRMDLDAGWIRISKSNDKTGSLYKVVYKGVHKNCVEAENEKQIVQVLWRHVDSDDSVSRASFEYVIRFLILLTLNSYFVW